MKKNINQIDLFAVENKSNQSKNILTAIDIGSDKIVCFIAKIDEVTREKRALRVVGSGYCQSKGIRNGRVVDQKEAEKSIRLAIDKAEQDANIEINSVYVCISGDFLKSHVLKGSINVSERTINQEHVSEVISLTNKKYIPTNQKIIHIVPSNFFVDSTRNVTDPSGLMADKLGVELNYITSEVNPLTNIENIIKKMHLNIEGFVAKPYASGLACLHEHELDFGSVCIDIGCGTTSISIFFEGTIVYAKTINLGGWYITNDVALGLQTSFEHAEGIKNLYGNTIMGSNDSEQYYEIPNDKEDNVRTKFKLSNLVSIIKYRYEEILEKVDEVIEKSGYSEYAKRNIILTGGTSDLPGSIEIAQRLFETNIRLGTPTKIGGLSEEIGGPSFSSCSGVLIHCLKKSKKNHDSITQKGTEKIGNFLKNLMGQDF